MTVADLQQRITRLPQAPGPAALVLRVVVGVVLVAHGLAKLDGGVEGFAAMVGGLGVPFPTLAAYATVTIEVLGGALLVAGLLTRLWAGLAALLMVGTTLTVKVDAGLLGAPGAGAGMELDLLILGAAAAVALIGPGPLSLDRLLRIDGAVPTARPRLPGRSPSGAAGSDGAPADELSVVTHDDEPARSPASR